MKLTKEQIEEIRSRTAASTGKNWVTWSGHVNGTGDNRRYKHAVQCCEGGRLICVSGAIANRKEDVRDMRFIAAAKTDIPALLAHIAALEAELDAAKKMERDRWESAAKTFGIEQPADPARRRE